MRKLLCVLLLGLWSVSAQAQPAAGVRWTAPEGWKTGPAKSMRAATYTMAPAPGDTGAAECVVYFFGAGQGGGVEANIERWKGQVLGANGQPAAAKVGKRAIHGLTVTTIDAAGAYAGMGGPAAAAQSPAAGYRLLGAVVEGPGGNLFIKFTGPEKTVAANQQKFEQLLASLEKEK